MPHVDNKKPGVTLLVTSIFVLFIGAVTFCPYILESISSYNLAIDEDQRERFYSQIHHWRSKEDVEKSLGEFCNSKKSPISQDCALLRDNINNYYMYSNYIKESNNQKNNRHLQTANAKIKLGAAYWYAEQNEKLSIKCFEEARRYFPTEEQKLHIDMNIAMVYYRSEKTDKSLRLLKSIESMGLLREEVARFKEKIWMHKACKEVKKAKNTCEEKGGKVCHWNPECTPFFESQKTPLFPTWVTSIPQLRNGKFFTPPLYP